MTLVPEVHLLVGYEAGKLVESTTGVPVRISADATAVVAVLGDGSLMIYPAALPTPKLNEHLLSRVGGIFDPAEREKIRLRSERMGRIRPKDRA